MKLTLVAIAGTREGESFVVDEGARVSFGRTTASDIAFADDGHMSSLHFEVANLGNRFEVQDRGSTNGTWLNNNRVSVSEVAHGDLLKAGKSVLRIELESAVQPVRETPPSPSPRQHSPEPGTAIPTPIPVRQPQPEPVVAKSKSPIQFSLDGDQAPPARSGGPKVAPHGNYAAAIGGGSPIESVQFPTSDAVPPVQPGKTNTPSSVPVSGNVSDNPFSDSVEFNLESLAAAAPTKKLERPGTQRRGYSCLERKIKATVDEALTLVLSKVMSQYSMRLVVHFQKIRMGVPSGIGEAEVLFDWFGSSAEGTSSPVLLGGDALDNPEFQSVLPRLCQADALMAFFGTEPKSLGMQIKAMMKRGITGFSEEGGFLAACWPSSFITMLDISGNTVCDELFEGNISGTVFCTPGHKQFLRAYANPDLTALLENTEFTERS